MGYMGWIYIAGIYMAGIYVYAWDIWWHTHCKQLGHNGENPTNMEKTSSAQHVWILLLMSLLVYFVFQTSFVYCTCKGVQCQQCSWVR